MKTELDKLEEQVSKGLTAARKKMLAFKKYKGTPVVVVKNGQIIKLKEKG